MNLDISSFSLLSYIKEGPADRRTMSTDATLTSKGQTTIPKEIRDGLQMKEGDRMTFTLLPNGTVLMRAQAGEPVRISLLVLLETEWVLRSRYKLTMDEILDAFSGLLSA